MPQMSPIFWSVMLFIFVCVYLILLVNIYYSLVYRFTDKRAMFDFLFKVKF